MQLWSSRHCNMNRESEPHQNFDRSLHVRGLRGLSGGNRNPRIYGVYNKVCAEEREKKMHLEKIICV